MKTINKKILKEAANKLMFDMSDEQYETLVNEFDVILNQMSLLDEIDGIESVTPMTFPFEVKTDFLREDVASEPLSRDEALKNATDVVDGQIRLPKVVG